MNSLLLAGLLLASFAAEAAAPKPDPGWMGMPAGDVFQPLLADPKQPQSMASALWGRTESRSTLVGAVAYGENIGLVRWYGASRNEGLQLGIAGAVFAQFDMLAESMALMNADYTIGLPLSYRSGRWSGRLRIYHQSSHLGDEYLITEQPERINLSYEALELIAAANHRGFRLYAGGELLFHRFPESLPVTVWHLGADYRHPRRLPVAGLGEAQLVGGLDLKRSWSEDRAVDLSLKLGLELGPRVEEGRWRRRWGLLAQYHDGNSPYGQFFTEKVSFLGVGIHFFL